jgi:hypothetical protein
LRQPSCFLLFSYSRWVFCGVGRKRSTVFFSLPAAGHRRERLRKTPMSPIILLTIPRVLNKNGPVSKPGKTLRESSKTFGVFCANPLVFFFFLTPAGCFVGLAENDKLCFFLFSYLPAAGHRRERLQTNPTSITILLSIPRV